MIPDERKNKKNINLKHSYCIWMHFQSFETFNKFSSNRKLNIQIVWSKEILLILENTQQLDV